MLRLLPSEQLFSLAALPLVLPGEMPREWLWASGITLHHLMPLWREADMVDSMVTPIIKDHPVL